MKTGPRRSVQRQQTKTWIPRLLPSPNRSTKTNILSGLMRLISGTTPTFLNKTRVRVSGQLTRAAIILFGRPDATHFLTPSTARISWVLKDDNGQERDYEHFGLPLILAVDRAFAKLRNNTYRYLPNSTLFPVEITQYDPWVIREVLHNAIAHQDYAEEATPMWSRSRNRFFLPTSGNSYQEALSKLSEWTLPRNSTAIEF